MKPLSSASYNIFNEHKFTFFAFQCRKNSVRWNSLTVSKVEFNSWLWWMFKI